jgi:hypothetical protein
MPILPAQDTVMNVVGGGIMANTTEVLKAGGGAHGVESATLGLLMGFELFLYRYVLSECTAPIVHALPASQVRRRCTPVLLCADATGTKALLGVWGALDQWHPLPLAAYLLPSQFCGGDAAQRLFGPQESRRCSRHHNWRGLESNYGA